MKAEIISIGTELLLGQITNTNASFLASELQSLGIDSYFQTTVGDNPKRIHYVLSEALKRSDIIITTGGLGPTSDDLTHEAITSFFKTKTILDKQVLKQIEKKFYLRGYKKMPEMNSKQAYKPKDAKWIPNEFGTANGIMWKVKQEAGSRKQEAGDRRQETGDRRQETGDMKQEDQVSRPLCGRGSPEAACLMPHASILLMTFPGVPSEMKSMWSSYAKPHLKKLANKNVLYSKTLKFTGIGESALAERIEPFFDLINPTVAPYASIGEVKIRVTARTKSLTSAKKLVAPIVKKILTKTKEFYFGEDEETLPELVAKLLIKKNKNIAIAESCTGGYLSKRLTDISGSSKYITLNVVTYSNDAKNKMLRVPNILLKKHGAVSSEVAASMALCIKELAKSDLGFSITGIAGPTGSTKEKPIGLVYFGLAIGNKVKTEKKLFGSNSTRDEIRWLATQFALNWIRKEMLF